MLAGGDERVLVVLDHVLVDDPQPAVAALDLVVADVLVLARAERAGVHEREVGEVEEVVDELAGADAHPLGREPHRRDAGCVPLGHLEQRRRRGSSRATKTRSNASCTAGAASCTRDGGGGVGAECGDQRAAALGPEAPAVVRALEVAVDHGAVAQPGVAVRAAVGEHRDGCPSRRATASASPSSSTRIGPSSRSADAHTGCQ